MLVLTNFYASRLVRSLDRNGNHDNSKVRVSIDALVFSDLRTMKLLSEMCCFMLRSLVVT